MKKQPIRIEKVEKYKKHISRVEQDKGRKLRPSERLAVIYDGNFKDGNTEQEEEEKGLSRKELYLILYDDDDIYKYEPYSDSYRDYLEIRNRTMAEDYRKKLLEEQDYNTWYPLLLKTKQVMRYFDRSSYKKMRRAGEEGEAPYFNINWMRTRKGAYYYYNMINEEDMEQTKKHMARCSLGTVKLKKRLEDMIEREEREEEEVRRGIREKTTRQLQDEKWEEMKRRLNKNRDKSKKDVLEESKNNNKVKPTKQDGRLDDYT